jgi:hypothetical protein
MSPDVARAVAGHKNRAITLAQFHAAETMFFFEKNNQKILAAWPGLVRVRRDRV